MTRMKKRDSRAKTQKGGLEHKNKKKDYALKRL